jgi:hypothetical protein
MRPRASSDGAERISANRTSDIGIQFSRRYGAQLRREQAESWYADSSSPKRSKSRAALIRITVENVKGRLKPVATEDARALSTEHEHPALSTEQPSTDRVSPPP